MKEIFLLLVVIFSFTIQSCKEKNKKNQLKQKTIGILWTSLLKIKKSIS